MRFSKQNSKTNLPFMIRVFVSRHKLHTHVLQICFCQSPANKNTISNILLALLTTTAIIYNNSKFGIKLMHSRNTCSFALLYLQ